MLSRSVEDALNDQIAHEFYAAYLYLSMMAYFESESLSGFGHWMRMQAREEVEHAMRLLDFVMDRGGKVELKALDRPASDFDSPLAVMGAALAHEQKVTGMINRLYELAKDEQDYPTQVLLQWFITEQVEEEASAGGIVDRLKIAGDSPSALLVLDGELAERGPEGDEDEG
jgi:ferritin